MTVVETQDNDEIETKSVLRTKLEQAKNELASKGTKQILQNRLNTQKIDEMSIKELAKTFGLPTKLQELEPYVMHKDGSFVNHYAKQSLLDKLRATEKNGVK